MDGVREVVVVHQPDKETDDADDLGEELTELIELLLKRCVFLFQGGLLDFFLDSSNGCFHSSVDNYADSLAVVDNGG